MYVMYTICCINKRTVETRDIIIYFLFLLLSLYNGIQKIALQSRMACGSVVAL